MTVNNKTGFVMCVSLLVTVLFITACGLVIPAVREGFSKNNKDDFIQHLDTNRNGKVSCEEYMAAFDRMDKDDSGQIESTEVP
jgi:Ca2+-binding EF-hand superfamily protein